MKSSVVTVVEEMWVPTDRVIDVAALMHLVQMAVEMRCDGYTITAVGVRFEKPTGRVRLLPPSDPSR